MKAMKKSGLKNILSPSSVLSLIPPSIRGIRAMGRSFLSTRQGVNIIAGRWARMAGRLRNNDGTYGIRLVEIAKQHSSEGFAGCNDPLEAVVFSSVVELLKNQDQTETRTKNHVDP
jgi:hypothetical protein